MDNLTASLIPDSLSEGNITSNLYVQPTPPIKPHFCYPGPDPWEFAPTLRTFWPDTDHSQWETDKTLSNYETLYNKVLDTALPNYASARIPINSGLKISNWRDLL